MPETDIWLFDLHQENGQFLLKSGRNVTARKGYDNQPYFSADGRSFYYVQADSIGQTDVYKFKIGKNESLRITRTQESEYSPQPLGRSINCVVVEKDSAQRIWSYDQSTGGLQKLIFNEDSVGYFAFLNTDTVLYYKLTEPHSLRARSLSTGADVFIAASVTRGFKALNRYSFLFGVKDSVNVSVYRYDTRIKKANIFAVGPGLSEDIVWHPQLGLLRSQDMLLFRYNEKLSKWEVLFDLSKYGLKKITRFAFDPRNKYLAIVDNQ